jgi:hypothetical protein
MLCAQAARSVARRCRCAQLLQVLVVVVVEVLMVEVVGVLAHVLLPSAS